MCRVSRRRRRTITAKKSFFWIPSLEGPTFAEGRGLGWLLGNEEVCEEEDRGC